MTFKFRSILFLLVFAIISVKSNGQNFDEGFDFLNSGDYAQAEIFFSKKLDSFPNSLNAIVGYGRAIGLGGRVKEANDLFAKNHELYPKNKDISMNYAESQLWLGDYAKAKKSYQELLTKYPDDAVVKFQLANIYSNLNQQDSAVFYINQALNIDPQNEGFLNSKKHIYLAYAYDQSMRQNYDTALVILDSLDVEFPNEEKVLFTKANTYMMAGEYKKANSLYQKGLDMNYDSKEGNYGMAVSHLSLSNLQRAMTYAKNNFVNPTARDSSILALAYLKTNRPNSALSLMNDSTKNIFGIAEYMSLKNHPEKAEEWISANDDNSRSMLSAKINYAIKARNKSAANMGLANYESSFKKDKSFRQLQNSYDNSFAAQLNSKNGYGFDSDSSTNYFSENTLRLPIGEKLFLSTKLNYKKLVALRESEETDIFNFGIGLRYLVKEQFEFYALPSFYRAAEMDIEQITYALGIKFKADASQEFHLGSYTEVQDFNINLLKAQLLNTHYFLNYSLNIRQKYGIFTQLYYTDWSDGNTRKLFYGSLYRILKLAPSVKTGINYQYFSFDLQKSDLYFSPEKFQLIEYFAELFQSEDAYSKNFYKAFVGLGIQNIDLNKNQFTYRVEAEYGVKNRKGNYLSAFVQRSNAASTSISGFTYTQLGIRFRWRNSIIK